MGAFIQRILCNFRQDRRFNRMDQQKRVRMKKYYMSGDSCEVRNASEISKKYPEKSKNLSCLDILESHT
ncbi:hypothetical protein Y032_0284g1340 [Ancylostoma ceylanicum]|uniref:Uncharacterized protein n=1 Tax=Ancylostoma ceylanicum TaxID=53326 RepID=A0A016S741_9BILA|nr:hypothetical protein Y032_0284g1340 [Ancylostoma ceylanicum]